MNPTARLVLLINLAAMTGLTFLLPAPMVAPGGLIEGHEPLASDCLACHQPFAGASSERCIACHAVAEIGLRTVAGVSLEASARTATEPRAVAFHQELREPACVACHSDHAGVLRYRDARRFSHALLKARAAEECSSCHPRPEDELHEALSGQCSACHTVEGWTPATFDHAESFVLDRDHDVECSTCHITSDYSEYTCYGCHEHSERGIRAEHEEEGIRDFQDCVECHRSADEDEAEEHGRGRRGEGERRGDDDDD